MLKPSLQSSNSQRIYFDHNATTPLDLSVVDGLVQQIQAGHNLWGNPSSIHLQSREPKNILRETRKKLATQFGGSATEYIFNSGASEGNNTVLKSVWSKFGLSKKEYLISSVEHPSVVKTAQYLESLGAIVKWIPVTKEGQIDLHFIDQNINDQTALVSVMFANNETGTLFPVEKISEIAKLHQTLMHVDAVQALGKKTIRFDEIGADYVTLSAHKFYAMKGCGVLYVKRGSPYTNLVHGGGQERGRRGGTENVIAIWSLQQMLEKINLVDQKSKQIEELRNDMEKQILEKIPQVSITAVNSPRLPNTSSLVIDGVDGETLLMSLDLKGFSVSTGAACSSGNPEPSPVLIAMGLSRQEAQSSLRLSLGWQTTKTEVDLFVKNLVEVVDRIRNIKADEGRNYVV